MLDRDSWDDFGLRLQTQRVTLGDGTKLLIEELTCEQVFAYRLEQGKAIKLNSQGKVEHVDHDLLTKADARLLQLSLRVWDDASQQFKSVTADFIARLPARLFDRLLTVVRELNDLVPKTDLLQREGLQSSQSLGIRESYEKNS